MSYVKYYSKPLYNNAYNHFFNKGIHKVVGADAVKNNPWVNISESDEGYLIELAAPGLGKEDLKIDVDKNILTIEAGQEKPETEEKESKDTEQTQVKYTRREFNYTSFKRNFTLPETVDTDKVTAQYENGVLKVSIPKKEEAKPKPAREISIG